MSSFDELVKAMPYLRQLEAACSTILEEMLRSPLWSPANPTGRRIPWRHAERARMRMCSEFEAPGLYIFGAAGPDAQAIPRYVGMTASPLWKRLSGRYIGGEYSQCQLAATYEKALREKGIDGFPPRVVEWYRENFSGTVRLQGAVDFARHGMETIWLALIPALRRSTVDKDTLEHLEQGLIRAGNRHNQERGYRLLVNKR